MPWTSVAHSMPPEGELVLLWDRHHNRMHTGFFKAGAWHAETSTAAHPVPLEHITHWAWILDSQLNWEEPED